MRGRTDCKPQLRFFCDKVLLSHLLRRQPARFSLQRFHLLPFPEGDALRLYVLRFKDAPVLQDQSSPRQSVRLRLRRDKALLRPHGICGSVQLRPRMDVAIADDKMVVPVISSVVFLVEVRHHQHGEVLPDGLCHLHTQPVASLPIHFVVVLRWKALYVVFILHRTKPLVDAKFCEGFSTRKCEVIFVRVDRGKDRVSWDRVAFLVLDHPSTIVCLPFEIVFKPLRGRATDRAPRFDVDYRLKDRHLALRSLHARIPVLARPFFWFSPAPRPRARSFPAASSPQRVRFLPASASDSAAAIARRPF